MNIKRDYIEGPRADTATRISQVTITSLWFSQFARSLSPAEKNLIDLLEWSKGRKLTPQEICNSLQQARDIGEL